MYLSNNLIIATVAIIIVASLVTLSFAATPAEALKLTQTQRNSATTTISVGSGSSSGGGHSSPTP